MGRRGILILTNGYTGGVCMALMFVGEWARFKKSGELFKKLQDTVLEEFLTIHVSNCLKYRSHFPSYFNL